MRKYILLSGLILGLVISFNSSAGSAFDWTLLPAINLVEQHANGAVPNEGFDTHAELDLVLSARADQWHFFTEIFADEDTVDIERLQIGLELGESDLIWLGRFHSMLGYWNGEFHHGAYIQTPITRPLIEQFADHGGFIPDHFTGLTWERNVLWGDSEVRLELGMGQGSARIDNTLIIDGINDGLVSGRKSTCFRLSYFPEAGLPDAIGVFAGAHNIPAVNQVFTEVDQKIFGGFANIFIGDSRYIMVASHFNNEFLGSSIDKSRINTVYIHAEYTLNNEWTPFWRAEKMAFRDNDPYLSLFTIQREQRISVGARWDFTEKQALKAEFIHSDLNPQHYLQFMLQWSATLP